MKKREINNSDMDQLFNLIIEQRPLLNEDQVISLLQQIPVTTAGRSMKGFIRNHLNTLIFGTLIIALVATLLWMNKGPETEKTMVQNNQLEQSKVEPASEDPMAVQSSTEIIKDSIQETERVDHSIKTIQTMEVSELVTAEKVNSVFDIIVTSTSNHSNLLSIPTKIPPSFVKRGH